jgi:Sec-independent protein translocase protein TatA
MIVNLFTGFTIKYFEIAYNAIAYIYIITAMLMIKSDLIKQQIEVGKIVEEQKKVREEKKEQENKEKEDKKPKEDKKEKKKDKEEKQEEGTPEGNQA